ncbi:MAG: hypothetical protein KR126chlam3_00173 [Chlamydiae bacterium]|nr:hypothetical protein [Chlamydiota bacterium]
MFRKLFVMVACCSCPMLFALSEYQMQPREYQPPQSVPQTSFMHTVDIPTYQRKFNEPIQDWLKETIDQELSHFKQDKITQRGLNATYNRFLKYPFPVNHYLRRYRIIGERIYACGNIAPRENDLVLRTLARLSDYPGIPNLPNVDFMINHNDGMPMNYDPPDFWIAEDKNDQAPILSGGKVAIAPYIIAVPHYFPLAGWKQRYDEVIRSRCPWREKKKAVCWRGNIMLRVHLNSPEAVIYNQLMSESRSLLCLLSLDNPYLINAGFSHQIEWIPSENAKRVFRPCVKGYLSYREYISHAYLPELDGAMISGMGFEWKLLANSLLFKVESPFVSWIDRGAVPYHNCIPVKQNMENLIEMINWAQTHDKECEIMANNGAIFAEKNASMEGIMFFFNYLFQEYEKCQDFNTKDLLQECERDPKWTRIR